MTWHDGLCTGCERAADVVHVEGRGDLCSPCLDKAAEEGGEQARETCREVF